MKKVFVVMLAAAIAVMTGCGVKQLDPQRLAGAGGKGLEAYRLNTDGTILAPDGVEYVFVCHEGFLELLGKKTRVGIIEGEEDQKGYGFALGLYACEQDTDRVMLLRYMQDSEWGMIYRKKTSPALDYSYQNCVRLELVGYQELQSDENMYSAGAEHINCGRGIAGRGKVADLFSAILSSGPATGLFELVEKEDGTLENCYGYGKIYGYFEGENAAVVPFSVTSYDDKAFSVMIDNVEYELPENYLRQLE